MSTIHELVAAARLRLRETGIPADEADLDARVLAQRLLQWDTARYFAHAEGPASEAFARQFERSVERRMRREPMAYIEGEQEFWGLSFEVSPAVLIPRPETELIVEALLERWPGRLEALRVADVCTGSGCLAVAIAHERPRAEVVATDISADAITIAQRNIARHSVGARVTPIAADVLTGIGGAFDAIVSNPPYVPEAEIATLQPEVVQYEPQLALAGGADGLDVVRQVVAQAVERLVPGGALFFEFGFGQGDAVRRLVADTAGLELLELRRDLQGIERTAVVRRRGNA